MITALRGTKDILPKQSAIWQHIEQKVRETCMLYNYQEIRTPIIEQTELFVRGIGETTDIVDKEMYTFCDKGGRSITLRPENTAAVVRAYLENKLFVDNRLVKLYYVGQMFRHERPQAGRQRQFSQFGIEAIGSSSPAIDAEVVFLAVHFLEVLGLENLEVVVNSVGCPACRPVFRLQIKEFLANQLSSLCGDCQRRFEKNPLRLLDCKQAKCREIMQNVPEIKEYLCAECKEHFRDFKKILESNNVNFFEDSHLVRGLDYYTKTAFEIKSKALGAQSAVCGGGRYDGLIEECGGNSTPAVGFAIGLERIVLLLEQNNLLMEKLFFKLPVFMVALGEKAETEIMRTMQILRKAGISCDSACFFGSKSMKAQMKAADKSKAIFTVIVGDDEILKKGVVLKNMQDGVQEFVKIDELVNVILKKLS